MTALTGRSGTVPLFATPFAAVDTGADPAFNAEVARFCEAQRPTPGSPLHFRSRDGLLESSDAPANLTRHILGNAAAVVASWNAKDPADFGKLPMQARAWCSIVQRDGHVPAQHFADASWLAVYCAQAGESDAGMKSAGVLRLYERRLGSIYRDASTTDLQAPYRFGNHTWSPAPGMMALFPAHLPHEVSVVRSDTPLILVFALIRWNG